MTLAAIVLIPLVASLLQLFIGKRISGWVWVTVGALGLSWILAMSLVVPTFFMGQGVPHQEGSTAWAIAGANVWQLGIRTDGLTLAMLFVVTTISLLIHIFSTSYMHGNPLYSRFFAYISFFTFAMLGLVAADNFFFFFICWELMGLCSYLLIGFYSWAPECGYNRETPAKAAIKAFLTTRIGDVGLFIGIGIFYSATGELTFSGIESKLSLVSDQAHLIGALFILSGAIGKSAQFPLHVWLPDAMEGPSPVSALIHAATMVAAGIYLVGRSIQFGLFPPEAMMVTAMVGSFTALFAATMALPTYDFKKVMAYSTISQLGFMLTALGVGGWTAGFFHLTTHAFFKALLFLGSGSVLHAVHTRDMREMGGLKAKMPITYWTMMAGALALAGFPGLAGFFSKDAILGAALAWGMEHRSPIYYLPFLFTITAAALTAFYTFRMMFLVFHGAPQDHHKFDHAHESPPAMWIPLAILAALAISSGWGWLNGPFQRVVMASPSAEAASSAESAIHESAHHFAMWLSITVALLGISLAWLVYHAKKINPDIFVRGPLRRAIHTTLVHLYWIDDFYMILVRAVLRFAELLGFSDRRIIDRVVDSFGPGLVATSDVTGVVDSQGVDYLVNSVADVTRNGGNKLRMLQTGKIQDYALGAMAAVLLLVLWISR